MKEKYIWRVVSNAITVIYMDNLQYIQKKEKGFIQVTIRNNYLFLDIYTKNGVH